MNILFITEFFPDLNDPVFSGGVETRMYYTAVALAKNNEVVIISRRKKEQKYKENNSINASSQDSKKVVDSNGSLRVMRLGTEVDNVSATFKSFFARMLFMILATIEGLKVKADIVEGSNYVVFLPTFLIGLIKRIPKIAWYPDVLIGQWIGQFGFAMGIVGEIAERVYSWLPWDGMITISEAAKMRLQKIGINKNKIEVIPCGVKINTSKFVVTEKKKNNQFLVVSRLVKYKRVDWAISLISRIKHKYGVDLDLIIVGDGPEKENLIAKAKSLGLQERVNFISEALTHDLYNLIARSRLLLHPSLIEGFGIVLVEAAALGTPFVAADIPTSIALMKSLKSGEVFKKDKFDDFVDIVVKLWDDDERLETMMVKGMKNSKKYDWGKLGNKTEKYYRDLIKI